MIGIVGGGLAAAKLVEGYREAGGDDEITIWSQDPHGPYHRPPLSKRLLRGEAEPPDALAHPIEWYVEHGRTPQRHLLDDVFAHSDGEQFAVSEYDLSTRHDVRPLVEQTEAHYDAVMDIVKTHCGAYGVGVEYAYTMVHGAPATRFPEYVVPAAHK